MNKHHRLGVIVLTILAFISCDKETIHDYYIQNNCEDTIIVDILDLNNKSFSIKITHGMEKLIYTGDAINHVYEDEITYFIKDIKIKKGHTLLNKDLLNYQIWHFEKKSQYNATSYLTIYPEDFENE